MSTMTSIRCGKCQGRHGSVADVRRCFNAASPAQLAAMAVFTEDNDQARMDAYKVQRDRLYPGTTPTTEHRRYAGSEPYTSERFWDAPKRVEQDGMYRNPQTGEIYKVQWNRGSGDGKRLYAKQLIMHVDGGRWTRIPLESFLPKPEDTHAEFQYAPGAMKFIRPEWRMSMEEARAFGALYGTCLRCGRTLTLEESIERAMGSTCAKKANWA
jgi:hypothetical protein